MIDDLPVVVLGEISFKKIVVHFVESGLSHLSLSSLGHFTGKSSPPTFL